MSLGENIYSLRTQKKPFPRGFGQSFGGIAAVRFQMGKQFCRSRFGKNRKIE